MSITTIVGAGSPTTLAVSTVTDYPLADIDTTDLLKNGTISVSGAGHVTLLHGFVHTTSDDRIQVNVLLDGVAVVETVGGASFTFSVVLSPGVHTIDYNVFCLGVGVSVINANLTVTDLGI